MPLLSPDCLQYSFMMLLEEWPSPAWEGVPSGPMWVIPLSMFYISLHKCLCHQVARKLALEFEMTSVSPPFLSDLRKACSLFDKITSPTSIPPTHRHHRHPSPDVSKELRRKIDESKGIIIHSKLKRNSFSFFFSGLSLALFHEGR